MWRGVTLQLFLVAVLPLTVLVLVVALGSLSLHHDAMRSLVADRNLRAVESAADSVGKEINHRGQTLEILAGMIENAQQARNELAKTPQSLAIFDGGLILVDSKEGLLVSFGSNGANEWFSSPEWRQYYENIQTSATGKVIYLPVQTLNNRMYIPVAVRNADGLTLIGLFSPEQLLSDSLSIISDQEPVTIIVVDPAYRILYRRGKLNPEEDLSTHPGFRNALEGMSGVDYLQTAEGEHVITSSSIQPVGWALMIEESWEDIASPLLQTTQNAPLIIIPVLGLAMLALWFGLRQIVQPMQALEKKAGDLANGNFNSIREPVGGVPEIGHLQDTLVDMAEKVEEAQDSLHSYIGAITDSVENERRNLARELHDDTLQSLIAIGQFTQYAKYWNKDEKVDQTLGQMSDQTDQAVKNLRRLVQGLRPIYIEDLGLATALAMQASRPGQLDGVIIHFSQEGQERRFKPEVEMALYRIAQEALSNIHRHSDAHNGWITLAFRAEEVILEIRDDGKGFELPPDPVHYARKGHYGLLGLYERADLIGAKLTIQSSPGDGVLIRVRLSNPMKGAETQATTNG